MEGFADRRSMTLLWSVVGVLGLGVVLAYSLPALNEPGDYYGAPSKVSLMQVNYALNLSGSGWFLDFLKAGILVAIVAAIAFPKRDRVLQGVIITSGSLLGLCLPYWIHGYLGRGESIGPGLWLIAIACLIAALLPWMLPRWQESRASAASPSSSSLDRPSEASATVTSGAIASRSIGLPFVIDPAQGAPGSTARAAARRFDPGQPVSIEWIDGSGSSRILAETIASSSGDIDVPIAVPADLPPGAYTVRAKAANGARWSSSFTIV